MTITPIKSLRQAYASEMVVVITHPATKDQIENNVPKLLYAGSPSLLRECEERLRETGRSLKRYDICLRIIKVATVLFPLVAMGLVTAALISLPTMWVIVGAPFLLMILLYIVRHKKQSNLKELEEGYKKSYTLMIKRTIYDRISSETAKYKNESELLKKHLAVFIADQYSQYGFALEDPTNPLGAMNVTSELTDEALDREVEAQRKRCAELFPPKEVVGK